MMSYKLESYVINSKKYKNKKIKIYIFLRIYYIQEVTTLFRTIIIKMPPRGFFEFRHASTGMYVFLILVMIITVYIIQHIADAAKSNKIVKKLNRACLVKCEDNLCKYIVKKSKSSDYYRDNSRDKIICIFTGWELSHIIFHSFIGFFFNIQTSLSIGVVWELIEHYHPDMNCGNILDIFYNMLGYSIGWGLQYMLI